MKTSLLLVIALVVTLGGSRPAAAENPGDNFFGYWSWTVGGAPPEYFFNPRDACIELVNQLNVQFHGDISFRGTKKNSNPDFDNDFTCLWTHDSTGSKDQSDDAASARYNCPANASAFTLNNTARIADYRCKCRTGTCTPLAPPAIDTSDRCKLASPSNGTGGIGVVQPPTADYGLLRDAQLLMMLEYGPIAEDLQATEDCTFTKKNFYKDAPSDVNIGFLCGFRDGDEAAANNAANLKSTPDGYVWHHNLDLGRMQLVTQAAHDACGSHIGGVAAWKEALGLSEYPFHLPPLQ